MILTIQRNVHNNIFTKEETNNTLTGKILSLSATLLIIIINFGWTVTAAPLAGLTRGATPNVRAPRLAATAKRDMFEVSI